MVSNGPNHTPNKILSQLFRFYNSCVCTFPFRKGISEDGLYELYNLLKWLRNIHSNFSMKVAAIPTLSARGRTWIIQDCAILPHKGVRFDWTMLNKFDVFYEYICKPGGNFTFLLISPTLWFVSSGDSEWSGLMSHGNVYKFKIISTSLESSFDHKLEYLWVPYTSDCLTYFSLESLFNFLLFFFKWHNISLTFHL